ncbi:hypothetical protein [uncultured Photobacterium sp.]|uniref:hypothetical protein n=1 Tax=uncultured Photobacterium sp. TaxID=173973 RepID=UPI002635B390|nr:hypothetical protein [uncultured Photobacterium sp.]
MNKHKKATGFGGINRGASGIKPQAKPVTNKIKLPSGQEISLRLHTYKGREEIQKHVRVDPLNIRRPEELTREKLADIYDGIANGNQITNAIGYQGEDGLVYVVDGSRRMTCADIADSPFRIDVSDTKIEPKDAEFIVLQSDKRKAFSYLDWGHHFAGKLNELKEENPDLTQKQFAEDEGVDPALMSRYLNAITLDPVFWSVMGNNEISGRLMNRMVTLNNSLADSPVEAQQLHDKYLENIGSTSPDELTATERFDLLNRCFNQLNTKKRTISKKVEPETLWNGSTAKQKVEWKQKNSKSAVINLAGLDEALQAKIKQAVVEALA